MKYSVEQTDLSRLNSIFLYQLELNLYKKKSHVSKYYYRGPVALATYGLSFIDLNHSSDFLHHSITAKFVIVR